MEVYNKGLKELEKDFQTNFKDGISDNYAQEMLQKVGENKLESRKKKTNVQRFFDQFKDAMIIILLIAAAVSFIVALNGHDAKEFFEPLLILLIVILNALMGVIQESKAEKSLEALQNMSAPKARVIRGGREIGLDAKEVVPGDIILVEAGDFVPADARLIEAANVKAEESALTGESVPAEKEADAEVLDHAPLGDRLNMIYSGCSITYGRAKAMVVATGMQTEMGKIAGMLNAEVQEQTPLQKKLGKLGKNLGFLALGICAVIFVIGIVDKIPMMEIFMTSVSLAVSAIPEGLPAIVTIVLSIGVTKMVKRNAIIRRLPAVETLGSASVICSDKTGTLTQNRMTLVKGYIEEGDVTEEISSDNSVSVRKLLLYGALCCDGSVVIENQTEKHLGDPTETSIILAAYKNGMPKDEINNTYPRVSELPFDSDRKLMTVVNQVEGKNIVITKGAFDMLADKCSHGNIQKAKELVDTWSGDALRVLAIAYKEIDTVPTKATTEELETDLTFMGLVGMIDPPRPEAREAVALCREAGIKPVMITGDHVVTASAIAKDLGILQVGDGAITGVELSAMSDAELDSRVTTISVYARVSPEDKIRIVKAWQKQGHVVSMTGDGVNDAPALKAADIGCAMGITGTDVAKGAADMTLTDDNFATIVQAVKEGRGIYDNIKKCVAFLLGTNIGEVFTVFISMLIFKVSPLLSMQLLWINLVTDSLPAIALGMEEVDEGVMRRSPKPKNESIFAHGLGVRVVMQGIMFAVLTIIGYVIGVEATGEVNGGRTMAFMVLAMTQIIHAFNMRSDHSLFKTGFFTNKYLNGAAVLSLGLTAIVLLVPQIAMVFGLLILPTKLYVYGLLLALVPLVVLESAKAVGLVKHNNK